MAATLAASDFRRRPRWWGGRAHILFTIVVFVILASLDNAAIGIVPNLYNVISRDLSVSVAAMSFVTASTILVAAFAAVLWGYWGDQGSRKRLLLYGTLIWGGTTFLTGLSQNFVQFLVLQLIAGIGLGCIATVGFSIISDFISPRRRGLAMSLWGLSQGVGMLVGSLLAGLLGADDWRLPFFVVSGAGVGCAALYLLTYEPDRGRSQPELSKIFESGGEYEERIELADLPHLVTRKSNTWLILQGFTAQFAYGSLLFMPALFQAKVEAEGYSIETATKVGSLYATLLQTGALFSLLAGHIGDVWQRRDPRGRAMLSTVGILSAIPLYVALFFIPLHGLDIPEPAGTGAVVVAVLGSFFNNAWVAGVFLLALGALALTSVDSPNWFALISDVNMPEHRGTVFGLGNLSNGVGRAFGNGLSGVTFAFLEARFLPPLNLAIGLAVFQIFFVPTTFCYYQATKTTPGDIADVKTTLTRRAEEAL